MRLIELDYGGPDDKALCLRCGLYLHKSELRADPSGPSWHAYYCARCQVAGESVLTCLLRDVEGDLHRDRTHGGGYVPCAGVLGNRERHRQQEIAEWIGKTLDRGFVSEPASAKGYMWVGHRDNHRPDDYRAFMDKLRQRVEAAGLGFEEQPCPGFTTNTYHIVLNRERIAEAERLHPEYGRILLACNGGILRGWVDL